MSYSEHAPPAPLTPWLECLWERQGTAQSVRMLPDGCIDLIWIEGIGAQVAGPNTIAFIAAPPAGARVVGARLRPGAAGALVSLIEPEALRDARPSAADALAEPQDKPHGQRVAFVRDPFGGLVELGTPM